MLKADPFPQSYNCDLNYSQFFTLVSGTSGLFGSEQVFRLNAPYDPDFTGTGHQPYGYDQISALYRRYIVTHVAFELVAMNPNADSVCIAAMLQSGGGSQVLTSATINDASERPNVVTKFLTTTGSQKINIRQPMFALHVLEGITAAQYSAETTVYGAAVGASPSTVMYLRIANASGIGGTGDTNQVELKLHMKVKFFERIGQSPS